jgi:hypothetical protein
MFLLIPESYSQKKTTLPLPRGSLDVSTEPGLDSPLSTGCTRLLICVESRKGKFGPDC